MEFSYRPYQVKQFEAVKAARDRNVQRQLLVAATGTGKTEFFAHLPKHLEMKDPTLVYVHREELAKQAAKKIQKRNPDFKVSVEMSTQQAERGSDVVVASTPTLYSTGFRRLEDLLMMTGGFGLAVPDEAHHYVADKYMECVNRTLAAKANTLLVGVTATPNRTDNAAMGQLFDEIVDQYLMREAMDDGYLAKVRGFTLKTTTDISSVDSKSLNATVSDKLAKVINTPKRNDEIVQHWLEHCSTRQTVAFCANVQHSKDLALAFNKRGIAAAAVWGGDPDREKKLVMHAMGQLQVITNCNVLVEGYDDWRIGCILMARPMRSQLLFVQMVGRGTRIQEGIDNLLAARQAGAYLEKEDCIILDVVDVTDHLSLVTLPSLFGLSPKMDLQGRDVLATAKAAEALQASNPLLDVSRIEDPDELTQEKIIKRVDLFQEKWAPEVESNSQLAWYTRMNGYTISLPTGERVNMDKDLLGEWRVSGNINGHKITPEKYTKLTEAFNYADMNLMAWGREFIVLLRRDAAFKKDIASPKQINQIVQWNLAPRHVAETMTKGQAGMLLSRKFLKGKMKTNLKAPAPTGLIGVGDRSPLMRPTSTGPRTNGLLELNPDDFNI